MEEEYYFTCPYCWSQVSILLDLSVEEQTYVEDCEICCNPIEISYRVENHDLDYGYVPDDDDEISVSPHKRDDDWDVWEIFNENAEVVDFEARRIDE